MSKKTAKKARTATVSKDVWMQEALQGISRIRANTKVTGEDIRIRLTQAGMSEPGHPNIWGALIRTAKNRKLIEDTGEKAVMTSEKARSRRSPVYRRLKAKA